MEPPAHRIPAGLEPPGDTQGRSLVGWARGEAVGSWRHDWLYEFRWQPSEAARAAGLQPIPRSLAVRGDRLKYVRFPEQPPPNELLFDLERDPWEDQDLAGSAEPALLEAQRRRLAELDELVRAGGAA